MKNQAVLIELFESILKDVLSVNTLTTEDKQAKMSAIIKLETIITLLKGAC